MANAHSELAFTVPQRQDFLEEKFELKLTEQSKRLFELGRAGQGYIGLVDLENGEMHLLPAFNKNDGLIQLTNENTRFPLSVESINSLGANTGDLHMRSAGALGLGNKGGAIGKLMGFGVWKSGLSVKFATSAPATLALIPEEFHLIKEPNKDWSLIYVNNNLEEIEIKIDSLPELRNILNGKNNFANISPADRDRIEQVLRETEHAQLAGIKYIKSRSSSQNFFSCKYDSDFQEYFFRCCESHSSHSMNLKREIPLPILEKIISKVYKELNLVNPAPLLDNPALDNTIRLHLELESSWENKDKTTFIKNLIHIVSNNPNENIDPKFFKKCLDRLSPEELNILFNPIGEVGLKDNPILHVAVEKKSSPASHIKFKKRNLIFIILFCFSFTFSIEFIPNIIETKAFDLSS